MYGVYWNNWRYEKFIFAQTQPISTTQSLFGPNNTNLVTSKINVAPTEPISTIKKRTSLAIQ